MEEKIKELEQKLKETNDEKEMYKRLFHDTADKLKEAEKRLVTIGNAIEVLTKEYINK